MADGGGDEDQTSVAVPRTTVADPAADVPFATIIIELLAEGGLPRADGNQRILRAEGMNKLRNRPR